MKLPIPIPVEAFGKKGQIVAIYPDSRTYDIRWNDGTTQSVHAYTKKSRELLEGLTRPDDQETTSE